MLMESVEIAGLLRTDLGIGLLPFAYTGVCAAAALQATDGAFGRVRGYWAAGTAFWVAGGAVTSLKVAAVLGLGLSGPLARDDTSYATSHQFTDLLVLAVLYVLAIVAEVGLVFVRRSGRRGMMGEDDVVELRSEFDWK